MRKRFLLIIIILFLCPNVYSLNKEQQDNISTYAIEMVQKGNERKAKDGTPLLKYGSGDTRLPAFKDELYKGHFVLNCDAFVSYILYHTYGFHVMKENNKIPYTTINYEQGVYLNSSMYKVARGSYNSIKPYLEKGDVIVAFVKNESTHTFLYVGDGLIAQARSAGMFVDSFDWYSTRYSDYMIVRLKEEGATKPVDMSIIWPDTKEREILGYDALPVIDVKYDSTKYYKEISATIIFSDDKKIDSYSVNLNTNTFNWINVDKKEESINYVIKENGTYNITVRDSKGQIATKSLVVNNIDNQDPIIENIQYNYIGNSKYDIIINAKDETKLEYSLDGVSFQQDNTFNDIELNTYELIVRDEALNKVSSSIKLTINDIPKFEVIYDKNYTQKMDIKIIPNNINNIASFAVQKELNNNVDWKKVNGEITYEINENGTYYIWLMDNNKVTYYEAITINTIDTIKPIIKKYEIVNEKINGFDVLIEASDECNLFYSKDGTNYQDSNVLKNLEYGDNTVYVKDCANNITTLKIVENNTIIKTYIVIILIISIIVIIVYMLIPRKKKKRKKNDGLKTE